MTLASLILRIFLSLDGWFAQTAISMLCIDIYSFCIQIPFCNFCMAYKFTLLLCMFNI